MDTKIWCAGVVLVWASLCGVTTSDPVRQLRYPRIYNAYITTNKKLQPSKAYPHSAPILQPGFAEHGFLGPELYGPGFYGPALEQETQGTELQPETQERNLKFEPQEQHEFEGTVPQSEETEPKSEVIESKSEEIEPKSEEIEPKTEEIEPKLDEVESKPEVIEPKLVDLELQSAETEPKLAQTTDSVRTPAISASGEKIYPSSRMMSRPAEGKSNIPPATSRQMNYPLTFYPREIGYYPHPFIPYSYPLAPQPFVFGGAPPGLGAPNGIYNFPTQVANAYPQGYPPQAQSQHGYPPIGYPREGNQQQQPFMGRPASSYKSKHTSMVDMKIGGLDAQGQQTQIDNTDSGDNGGGDSDGDDNSDGGDYQ